jgi:hypothetical protein
MQRPVVLALEPFKEESMLKKATALLAFVAAAALVAACSQSDAGITTKVKSKLAADPTVKASQIDVDTKNKVVTLNGTVDNQAAKDQAISIARGTAGVADVVDNLTVSGSETGTAGTAGMEGTTTGETTTTSTTGSTGTTGAYGTTGTTGSAGATGSSGTTGSTASSMSTTPNPPPQTTPQ